MSLERAAVKGARWTTLSMIVVTIVQLLRIVVLGRLLGSEAFGFLAMMLVVIGFAELLGQLGVNEAIIQQSVLTKLELSSLFWLNIILGIAVYVILLLASPFISVLYSSGELAQFLPWISLVCLISPLGAQFKSLLQRNLNFKPLAVAEMLSAVLGCAVAIALGVGGYGVWSLVWGQLTQSFVLAIVLFFVGWREQMWPDFRFQYSAVKPYLSFGIHLMGSNLLNYFNSRVDQLVIGALLGASALGFYSMTFALVVQPISKVNLVLTQVAFPVMSKVKGSIDKLRTGYLKMLEILVSINAPLLIGAAVTAPLLVRVSLGEAWMPMVPLIQVLSVFSLIRATGNAGGSLILACGRADWAFYWNLMLFAFIPLAVIIGAKNGAIMGVACTLLVMQLLLFFVWYYFVVRRLIGDCFSRVIASMIAPIFFSLVMASGVAFAARWLANLSEFVQLSLSVAFGAAIYIGLYLLFRREFVLTYIRMLLKN